jgi:preprotein translocase, SecE subunit, bacterial
LIIDINTKLCYFICDTAKCFYFGKLKVGKSVAVKEKKVNTNQYIDDVENFKVDEVKKEKSSKKNNEKKEIKKSVKKETVKKTGFFGSIKKWFKGVIKEMKAVHWPSKKEMIKYSIATIVFVIFFAIFFLVLELIMTFLLDYFG